VIHLLKTSEPAQRKEYAQQCVDNLKAQRSVFQSLRLLRRVVDLFSVSGTSAIVDALDEQAHLLDMFFQALRRYHVSAVAKLQAAGRVASADEVVVTDGVAHLRQVNVRFDFLYFILKCSSLVLSTEQALLLWDCMVVDACTPEEQRSALDWLRRACTSQGHGYTTLGEGTAAALFTTRMITGNAQCPHTKTGLECLFAYFVLVNEAAGRLKRVGRVKKQAQLQVMPDELVGLRALWAFALEAADQSVADTAIGHLNQVYSCLGDSIADRAAEVQQSYIQACMAELKTPHADPVGTADTATDGGASSTSASGGATTGTTAAARAGDVNQTRLRALSLLQTLLHESELRGAPGPRAHGARLRGPAIKVRVNNKIRRTALHVGMVDATVHGNTTVWELRYMLQKMTGDRVPADSIRLYFRARELRERANATTMTELKVREGSTFISLKAPPPRVAKAALLSPDNKLTPRAREVFTDMFEQHSNDGRMTREDCAGFLDACNGTPGSRSTPITHPTVVNVFQFHARGKEYITLENFLAFYRTSCRCNAPVVWANLSAFGYRNDLQPVAPSASDTAAAAAAAATTTDAAGDDNGTEEEPEVLLPREVLARNDEHVALFFHLLRVGGEVTRSVWRLLMRLPTNPTILTSLQSLEAVHTPSPDWDTLLDSR